MGPVSISGEIQRLRVVATVANRTFGGFVRRALEGTLLPRGASVSRPNEHLYKVP